MATMNYTAPTSSAPAIEVQLCIPDDQRKLLPRRPRAPVFLPVSAPIPGKGDVVYLGQASAWAVGLVVHQWRNPSYLRIEVWLQHLHGDGRAMSPSFELTQ